MDKLKLIIVREFLSKVRNKSFIIMTFLSPILMIGLIALVAFLTKTSIEKPRTVAYINQSRYFTVADFKNTKTLSYVDMSHQTLEAAKTAVQNSELTGLLVIPNDTIIDSLAVKMQFYSTESPGVAFVEGLQSQFNEKLKITKMLNLGLDTTKVASAEIRTDIHLNNFSGETTSKLKNEIKLAIGATSGYLIMMFIIIYGAMVMRSVIEEKTSRIIEVIISSVKPFYLMLGKVIGTAGAGIFQFLIWIVVLTVLSFVVMPLLGMNNNINMTPEQLEAAQKLGNINEMELAVNEILQLPLVTIILSFILFFTGGYLLYSSLYAAIGAAVDNETDTQQFMMPIIMPLMLGMYIGFGVVINDPHGTLATIFSMVPFTSPIVMMMRIPMGVPTWQIIISLVLLFGTFLGMIWLSAKIYRVGILMYGKKPTYKELWKWMRY
jgi:ABC-2 type transport system permease protein